ncbi:MAG: PEP-CTERM sorting domain-containing protein [Verrucomicrobiales bacterium]|nr:PEP-CTERM sorting domain-containing protein [Verrucomicrobiales bacterium]
MEATAWQSASFTYTLPDEAPVTVSNSASFGPPIRWDTFQSPFLELPSVPGATLYTSIFNLNINNYSITIRDPVPYQSPVGFVTSSNIDLFIMLGGVFDTAENSPSPLLEWTAELGTMTRFQVSSSVEFELNASTLPILGRPPNAYGMDLLMDSPDPAQPPILIWSMNDGSRLTGLLEPGTYSYRQYMEYSESIDPSTRSNPSFVNGITFHLDRELWVGTVLVPEPTSALLVACGAAFLMGRRRRLQMTASSHL